MAEITMENELNILILSLEKSYCETNDHKIQMEIIDHIIEVKSCLQSDTQKEDIYVWSKKYITAYLKTVDDEKFDYDHVDLRILNYHHKYLDRDKCYRLCQFIERQLLLSQHLDKCVGARENTRKYKSEILFRKFTETINPWYLFNGILVYSAISIRHIVGVLFLLFILLCILLLPAPIDILGIYRFDQFLLSTNEVSNYMMNILSLIAPTPINATLVPLNSYAFFLITFFKLLFYIFILNFLINEIVKRVNLQ